MTDLLTTDDADSGEILPWDTVVLEVAETAEPTRALTGYAKNLPPTSGLRRPDADETAELPTLRTIAVIPDLLPPGQPRPPVPLPTPPPKPTVAQPRHRHRQSPPWSPMARRALLCWVGLAVVELAGLAALAVTR